MRFNLYLNEQEFKDLSQLKIKTGYTKNALIRQMINEEKKTSKIQEQREIHKIFVSNLNRIGNNLNQIAYKLNTNAQSLNKDSLSEIFKEIKEIKSLLKDYKENLKEQEKPKKTKYHKEKTQATKEVQNV